MELCIYKRFSVVLLLHLCQGQDPAVPSPSPESVLPSLGDVMDAVKATFMEAVKILKDDGVGAVFEQVVEELGPLENIAEKPSVTADNTEDGLPAVVHEHGDNETTSLTDENAKQEQAEPKLNSSEQMLVLQDEEQGRHGAGLSQKPGEKQVEVTSRRNKSDEESVQEVEDPVPIIARDLVELTQEPKESFEHESEDKSPSDQKEAEQDESQVWSFESASVGERERAGVDVGKHQQVEAELVKVQEQVQKTQDTYEIGEMEIEDGQTKDVEADIESKIHKGGLFELAKQTEPQPDQDQAYGQVTDDDLKVRIVVEEKQNQDEQRQVDVGGHVVEVKTEKEDMGGDGAHIGEESVGREAEMEGLIAVSKAIEKTSQELATDVTQETNELNDIVTSRDPVINWDVPTLGISGKALPPFPTVAILVELGESDELVEEPADKTQPTTPKQEAWKIGVIALAFFLILQTLVTAVYILKCKRRRNSCAVPERVCEDGIEAVEHDAANADTDGQTTVDDLPECSANQQETFAMIPIHTHSMVEKSFNH